MEEHDDQSFDFLNIRFLLAAFAVVATLAFVSGAAFGADKASRVDRAELHIQDSAICPCRVMEETRK